MQWPETHVIASFKIKRVQCNKLHISTVQILEHVQAKCAHHMTPSLLYHLVLPAMAIRHVTRAT